MSLLLKNSFLEKIDLNDAIDYKTKLISSKKEEFKRKAQSSNDLCSEDVNSNSTSSKNKIKLLY